MTALGSALPPDDNPVVAWGDSTLVLSSSWGVLAPGEMVSAHVNAVGAAPSSEFDVGAELVEVDDCGTDVCRIDERHVRIQITTDAVDIYEGQLTDKAPANYRLTLNVAADAFAAAVTRYLTVPPQELNAELDCSARAFAPGNHVPFDIVNHGPTELCFGVDYTIERAVGDHWQRCNVEEAWALPLNTLPPGERAHQRAVIPDDAPPGRYRITKHVSATGTALERSLEFRFTVSSR